MIFTPPLSPEDAATIVHAAEIRILQASLQWATDDDAARYGEARRWLVELMQGHPIEIDENELAYSRAIMTKRIGG